MFSRNVQFAPRGRNNRRRPRTSVREASDDRGFNASGWPDFTWENGDISALPGRSPFPTDTFDHRCIRRRCPESLPLPRHRSHKFDTSIGTPGRHMTDRDKGLCCAIKGLKLADPGNVRLVFWFVLHALDCLPLSLEEFFMHESRHSKEPAAGRTLHKTLRLMQKCLLLGLMAAISLDAQHSAPSVTTWAGVVRTVAGEPVAKAK